MRISDWSSDVCSSDLPARSWGNTWGAAACVAAWAVIASCPLQQGLGQLGDGAGAMAHRFLLLRVHLAEGDLEALGLEHRVAAEAAVAADRPNQGAPHAARDGGGDRKSGGEGKRGAEGVTTEG